MRMRLIRDLSFVFFTEFNGAVYKMQGTRFGDAGLARVFHEIMEFATDQESRESHETLDLRCKIQTTRKLHTRMRGAAINLESPPDRREN